MTAFAQSNRAAMLMRREVAWGETPVYNAGTPWSTLRITSESLDLDKKTVRSEVIRPDRMNDALLYVGRNTAGDISGELSFGDWDDLMCGALGANAWTVGGSDGSDVSVVLTWAGPTGVIHRAAGSWLTAGILPNTLIAVNGFVAGANNGNIFVTAVTASDITFLPEPGVTPVTETLATMGFHYEYLLNSVSQIPYVAEKQFQDITKFAQYNGLYANTMSVDITSMEIVKIVFGFMGKDNTLSNTTLTGTGGQVLASGTTPPVTASVNVGQLLLNGLPITTGLKSLKFDTNNNLRIQDIIGSATPGGFGQGSFDLKGTTEAYLEDTSLWATVLSHANVAQLVSTKDVSGNEYAFGIPLANFTKGAGKVGGRNQDVMLPLEWEASRDPTTNAMLAISRSTKSIWT